jgi:hypothetical protein
VSRENRRDKGISSDMNKTVRNPRARRTRTIDFCDDHPYKIAGWGGNPYALDQSIILVYCQKGEFGPTDVYCSVVCRLVNCRERRLQELHLLGKGTGLHLFVSTRVCVCVCVWVIPGNILALLILSSFWPFLPCVCVRERRIKQRALLVVVVYVMEISRLT